MKNLLLSFLMIFCQTLTFSQSPYKLPELGFTYNALEPYIDAMTMEIHLTKHHAAYVNNLNTALKGTNAENLPLLDVMKNISAYSPAVRNNAGGHFNHSLFWTILTPEKNTQPSKDLMEAINDQFTSMDSLKTLLNKAAATRFGSGWAWLYINSNKKLAISSTPNQDNPYMDVVEQKGIPILGIDVWEHAYYLKYQNKRGDYLAAIWNVINWQEVSRRYHEVIPVKKGKFDEWPEIKDFHKTLSETFHPSEEGDLKPIRTRSGEMVKKAITLSKSKIPNEFNNKAITDAIKKLESGSKALDKIVRKKGSDKAITKSLHQLHDIFHLIVDKCVVKE
jgi:superoxide dismutase